MPSTCTAEPREATPVQRALEATRPRSHNRAVLACYATLVVIVVGTMALDRLIPSPIAATLFLVLVSVLALWLHPTLARRGRRRTSRRI